MHQVSTEQKLPDKKVTGGSQCSDSSFVCRVCEEMLRTHLYPPTSETLALMCGPPGMQDASMVHLEKWGFKKQEVIIF